MLTTGDREALDVEYQQMMAQVNHVANNTEAFGIFPLRGNLVAAQTPSRNLSSVLSGTTPHITDIFPISGHTLWNKDSGIAPLAYIPQGATDITIELTSYGMDDDVQIFTADGKHLVGTPISDVVWSQNGVSNAVDVKTKVLKNSLGFETYASYDSSHLLDGSSGFSADLSGDPSLQLSSSFNGMKFNQTGDGDYTDGSNNNGQITNGNEFETIHIDKTTEPLIVIVNGTLGGNFTATVSWGTMPAKGAPPIPVARRAPLTPSSGEGLNILTSATPGLAPTFVTIEKTPTDTKHLGLVGSALNPLDEVMFAMDALDAAIDQVANYAAKQGAVEARLDHALSNAGTSSDITSAARSRIMDTDFATETAQLSAHMIRSSAATAMSAQANLAPKLVLALLGKN